MADFLKKKKFGKAPKAFGGGRSGGGKSKGFKGFKAPKPPKASNLSGDSGGSAKPRQESKPKAMTFKSSFGSGPKMSDGQRKRLEKIQI